MIKPGSRWKSVVCAAEAVVVRPPQSGGVPQCGGVDMVPAGEPANRVPIAAGFDGGCGIGKRYQSESGGVELLCTKAGDGALGFAGEKLLLVETKKLPASD